jgi:hypothetical protein
LLTLFGLFANGIGAALVAKYEAYEHNPLPLDDRAEGKISNWLFERGISRRELGKMGWWLFIGGFFVQITGLLIDP